MTAGVRQIVRFNWTFYLGGMLAVAVAVTILRRVATTPAVFGVAALGLAVVSFWIVGSLGALWLVYDRSELTRWEWVGRTLGFTPKRWITIHAGLDESSPVLARSLGSIGRAFDVFDPHEMTEASIARARRQSGNEAPVEHVSYRHLPVDSGSVDAALLLLAAHELRSHASRVALFTEIQRVLTPTGKAVVAEHLRDAANATVFGPGALHFHSRRTWLRCFEHAQLAVSAEFGITPFVRVFVLEKKA